MVKLTEDMVIARAKTSDMETITKLNFWGSDLTDIFLVRRFKRAVILSFSLNMITTLADFQFCTCLSELYIRRNKIQNLREVCYLQELPKLKNLLMSENPCCETAGDLYRPTVLRALPQLSILDNQEVTPLELEYALQLGLILEHPRKDKDKPIIPCTKYYEGPPDEKSTTPRLYEEMIRQNQRNNIMNRDNPPLPSLRMFVNNQNTSKKSPESPLTTTTTFESIISPGGGGKSVIEHQRPATATPKIIPTSTIRGGGHQQNEHAHFPYHHHHHQHQHSMGGTSSRNSVSDYRSLINHQRSTTNNSHPNNNSNNNTSPILEFYRNDFSQKRSSMDARRRVSHSSGFAEDFPSNNHNNDSHSDENDNEYSSSTMTSVHKSTNIVSAAILLFADMDLEDLYAVENAIRSRIYACIHSSGQNL